MAEATRDGRPIFSSDQYRMLLEVGESIAAHRDLSNLFEALAQLLPRLVPFDFINLFLHDSALGMMRLHLLVTPEPSRGDKHRHNEPGARDPMARVIHDFLPCGSVHEYIPTSSNDLTIWSQSCD